MQGGRPPGRRSWALTISLPGRRGPARRRWLAAALVLLLPALALWAPRQWAGREPWPNRAGPPATAPLDYWVLEGPGREAARDLCGPPGWPDPRRYGPFTEEEAPWAADPPDGLRELQAAHQASPFIAGFRITFPEPLFDEAHNVGLAARKLAGHVVMPGETFSLNRAAGPYTAARGYRMGPAYMGNRLVPAEGGGVCKIASTLYNVVLHSGLEVVQRHPHSMPVPYVPPGRDATVAWPAKDFRFRNNRDVPVVIWSQSDGHSLYVALYGRVDPPQVEWEHQVLSRQEPWTIRQPNDRLAPGEERVVLEGYPGMTVRTWLTIRHPGREPERRDLGIDTYLPMPRLIEYGP
ncbi:MAG TPA: VanW family protein [Sphingobacteriaceae bacterium]|nr:VanW family protein [Sphingobacteriaceae bacterium]